MIFSTLSTLQNVMIAGGCYKWTVYNSEGDQMQKAEPEATTPPADSFNTLKIFLEALTGQGYVLIHLYDKSYKPNSGGQLKGMVYKHFYSLSPPASAAAPVAAISNGNGHFPELTDLRVLIAEMKKDREIDDLKRQLQDSKKESRGEGDYFTRVARAFGKTAINEYLRVEHGITGLDDEETEDTSKALPERKPAAKPAGDKSAATDTPAGSEIKEIATRASNSTFDIMKALKKFGVPEIEVVKGLEELAKQAEANPLQFKETLKLLGVKEED